MNNGTNSSPIPAGRGARITADSEAERYLELQLSLSKKNRLPAVLLTVLTMGFVFILAALFWIMPDKSFSDAENRTLKTAPTLTRESFFSGQYTADFAEYMADQFPFRDFFVGLKAATELAQLKGENNGIIIAQNGFLTAREDFPDGGNLETNLSAAGAFIDAAKNEGIECFAAFAGRKQDVYDSLLPDSYGSYCSDLLWSRIDALCGENGFTPVNLRDPLRALAAGDTGLYYKTDHHWTTRGAYLAYRSIMESMGEVPFEAEDFSIETASRDFYGTTWSSAGVKWASGDTIEYYRYPGDEDFTMKILDPSEALKDCRGCTYIDEDGEHYACFKGFYVTDFLAKKDKYASFIGGNFGITKITSDTDENRETLCVLKDSFSHSMAPFLARHYNLVMIDLRYCKKPILRYCTENGIDKVLFLYNAETLGEGNYLRVLRAGLPK